jgi:hypothetical protein
MRQAAALGIALVALAACDRQVAKPNANASPSVSAPVTSTTASAPAPAASASGAPSTLDGAKSKVVSFDEETIGGPSKAFEAVVGDWLIAEAGGARGYQVDGAKWRDGTPSASLADQAKRLYGDRYAEFLDGVKAFAFYPLAVSRELPPAGDIKISVRFFPIAGKVDQAAGIAFGIAPDGSYLGARANALEDNLLYFKVVKGKRNVIDTIRAVPTPTRTWHTLSVELRGKHLVVLVDDIKRLDKTLDAVPSGRVGLWSKADSQVLFDDFAVSAL